MKHIAVLGSGIFGEALSSGFLKFGYNVIRGTRDPGKLSAWANEMGPAASVAAFEECAAQGDAVVLAVNGAASEAVVASCADGLEGKVVMDVTNPIENVMPEDGVMRYFTDINESLMERLQKIAPAARFVKVFSCINSAYMVEPEFEGGPPTMFICGNDDEAKAFVTEVLGRFGWEWEDMGAAAAARAIEPLAMLYCIPGIREQRWNHAFKWLRL